MSLYIKLGSAIGVSGVCLYSMLAGNTLDGIDNNNDHAVIQSCALATLTGLTTYFCSDLAIKACTWIGRQIKKERSIPPVEEVDKNTDLGISYLKAAGIYTPENHAALFVPEPKSIHIRRELKHLQRAGILTQKNLDAILTMNSLDSMWTDCIISELSYSNILTQNTLDFFLTAKDGKSIARLASRVTGLHRSRIPLTEEMFILMVKVVMNIEPVSDEMYAQAISSSLVESLQKKGIQVAQQDCAWLGENQTHARTIGSIVGSMDSAGILKQMHFELLMQNKYILPWDFNYKIEDFQNFDIQLTEELFTLLITNANHANKLVSAIKILRPTTLSLTQEILDALLAKPGARIEEIEVYARNILQTIQRAAFAGIQLTSEDLTLLAKNGSHAKAIGCAFLSLHRAGFPLTAENRALLAKNAEKPEKMETYAKNIIQTIQRATFAGIQLTSEDFTLLAKNGSHAEAIGWAIALLCGNEIPIRREDFILLAENAEHAKAIGCAFLSLHRADFPLTAENRALLAKNGTHAQELTKAVIFALQANIPVSQEDFALLTANAAHAKTMSEAIERLHQNRVLPPLTKQDFVLLIENGAYAEAISQAILDSYRRGILLTGEDRTLLVDSIRLQAHNPLAGG